jgi:transcriptional regulator with XRE-family HTH domain
MPDERKRYILERRKEMGHRLREARQEADWTQEEAADYLNCSRAKVNRAEQGETELTGLELELLAKAYCKPVTYFYRRLAEFNVDAQGPVM